ncbi:MAG: photosynthetic complex putative assembly protein PuhB [Rubrivivax sp.]|nr:photosynthetic complex putative assembly protein PuhB [Rubrivivax sp.]
MKAVRTNAARREHEYEPVRGLPEDLPAGETLLWQGSPDWKRLAQRAFHVRKLMVYFAALMALRVAVLLGGTPTAGEVALSVLWMAVLAGTALGLLSLVAWLSARGTVYTVTNRRVVMRVGIVLTLTFNIPFKRITAAGLHLEADGTGDLPLTLSGEDRIAWLHLWPHARPWRLARPEPMLRSVPNAAEVARVLTEAWARSTGLSVAVADAAAAAGQRQNDHGAGMPALAGR